MQTEAKTRGLDETGERRSAPRIEKMSYRAAGTSSVPARSSDEEGATAAPEEVAAALVEKISRLEGRLGETERSAAARIEQLRREGAESAERERRQAEQRSRAAIEAAVQQVEAALRSFEAERNEYFARVEREVVGLALAIAARILHREALLDPLLLAGAVRVALGQLGQTTGVRLRCPAAQVGAWTEMLGSLPDLPLAPEVVGDEALANGDCVLETLVGTVDLGVKAQLEEIERGFFDLLEQRPRTGDRLPPVP